MGLQDKVDNATHDLIGVGAQEEELPLSEQPIFLPCYSVAEVVEVVLQAEVPVLR